MSSLNCVALIPLRGGSKGIKNKNIKPFFNKPLCCWALEAALNSNEIEAVFVSTDSEKIKKTVLDFDSRVEIIDRPDHLASDEATTESVMLHFSNECSFNSLVTIQATSPMLKASDLDSAVSDFNKKGYDSLFSAVRTKRFFWEEESPNPINYDHMNRPRRQDFNGLLMENGAFYITSKELLTRTQNRLGGVIGYYEMSEENSLELDEPLDWLILEEIARNKLGN